MSKKCENCLTYYFACNNNNNKKNETACNTVLINVKLTFNRLLKRWNKHVPLETKVDTN